VPRLFWFHEYFGLDQEYRLRLKRKDQIATLGLSAGDWIEMTKPGKKLPAGARGHIVKIRRGRLDVHFPQHGHWTIPASLARKVDGPPPAATK
jgi:thioesterase domain-containing protein